MVNQGYGLKVKDVLDKFGKTLTLTNLRRNSLPISFI
jgi:hypothetical protein